MLEKTITLNRPNWLASEKNFVSKTITVPVGTSSVTENGRTIVKSGTIFTSPYYGLLVNDVDITDGAREAALMVGGYYIDAQLPSTAASYVSNFAATGLFPLAEGSVTRPDFGQNHSLTELTMGTVSAALGVLTWSAVTGATKYELYTSATSAGTYTYVDDVAVAASPTVTVTETGYYKVKAIGDNLFYSDSPLSAAVQVSALS